MEDIEYNHMCQCRAGHRTRLQSKVLVLHYNFLL
jgi:hypothetical protein